MPRYIVTIRRPEQPTVYYLSKSGFRCYSAVNVAVYRNLNAAVDDRNHFANLMPEFRLSVEKLPARVRSISRAVLSAVPAEQS